MAAPGRAASLLRAALAAGRTAVAGEATLAAPFAARAPLLNRPWAPTHRVLSTTSPAFKGALPPHAHLTMPALSPTMTAGNIAAWKKAVGETVAPGDVLAEVETDKATMEWEAQEEGVLAAILAPDGSRDIPVGTPVAVLVEEGGDAAAFVGYQAPAGGGPSPAASATPAPAVAAAAAPASSWPPHTVVGLPALSPTMSAGNIAAWKKKAGDAVAPGDVIADVETDKATMEWEAQEDGWVAALLVGDGDRDIGVGAPVLVLVDDEALVAAFAGFTASDAGGGGGAAAPAAAPAAAAAAPEPTTPGRAAAAARTGSARPAGTRVAASPYARKLAAAAGVDVAAATPTGPKGRVVGADVEALVAGGGGRAGGAPSASAAPGDAYASYTDVPHTQIRRVTATRLLQSKQTVPHYYLTVDVRVDALLDLRARLNEATAAAAARAKKGGDDSAPTKLSVNDFVLKASALALRAVPGVNAAWAPDFTRMYKNVDINVAVQAPTGLMVPLLTDVDKAGLADISARVKAAAVAAAEGTLSPADMAPGTFTVSNLGMFGVASFSAIVNPPQAAILAVGGARPAVIPGPDGSPIRATLLAATLSCDHRVVDGALGAAWLAAFRGYIEAPETMLL